MAAIFRKFAISYPDDRLACDPRRATLVRRLRRIAGVIVLAVLAACSDSPPPQPVDAVLIRTDRQTISMGEFERAFSAARIAYSDDRDVDPRFIEQARLRLLNQMVEEVIIKRRAEELGIVLEDQELEAAISAIKQDYPEDEFDQMLLESAVPYSLWRDRLRMRLLMEKVVDHDLDQSLTVTAEEIEAYYKAHEKEFVVDTQNPPEVDLRRQIVERLRRDKVETAYPEWMDGLRQRYQVQINWDLWGPMAPPEAESAGRTKD